MVCLHNKDALNITQHTTVFTASKCFKLRLPSTNLLDIEQLIDQLFVQYAANTFFLYLWTMIPFHYSSTNVLTMVDIKQFIDQAFICELR